MTNAELIKALRWCANENTICTEIENCGYYGKGFFCQDTMMLDAADALEAADKRIAELEAQLPKEGEWIDENRRTRSSKFVCSTCKRTCYDIQPTRDKAWTKRCRYNYCPNCGCRMDGATEYVSTYSLGKIPVPKGAIKQIIEDGKEKDNADS